MIRIRAASKRPTPATIQRVREHYGESTITKLFKLYKLQEDLREYMRTRMETFATGYPRFRP